MRAGVLLLCGGLVAVAPPAAAQDGGWKQVKARVAYELAQPDLRAPKRALQQLTGRPERDAATVALSILAANSLAKGARDKKGFGVARPAIARRQAIATLAACSAPEQIEVLLGKKGAASRSWEVRSAVLTALGWVGRALWRRKEADGEPYGHIWAALVAGAEDPDAIIRTCATAGLGRLPDPKVGAVLVARLADAAWQPRLEAIWGLARLGDVAHVPALIDALGREHGRLQGQVLWALKKLTGGDLGTDPDLWTAWWEVNQSRSKKQRKQGQRHATRARPRFYGIPVDSERLAFVIDVTGSMHRFHEIEPAQQWLAKDRDLDRPPYTGDTLMALAKYQLSNVVREVPDTTWFTVVLYSTSQVRAWEERLVRATPPNRKSALKFVKGMSWAGDTNLYDGLLRALAMPAQPATAFHEGPDTVYLFTDGWPNAGVLIEREDIADAVQALCAFRRVRVHTIGLAVKKRWMLQQLAQRTGGKFINVPVPIDQVRESQHSHKAGG